MKKNELFTRMDYDIKYEINRIVELMGGKSDILSIIGSWKDTLEDDEVLEYLKCYKDILIKEKGLLENF